MKQEVVRTTGSLFLMQDFLATFTTPTLTTTMKHSKDSKVAYRELTYLIMQLS